MILRYRDWVQVPPHCEVWSWSYPHCLELRQWGGAHAQCGPAGHEGGGLEAGQHHQHDSGGQRRGSCSHKGYYKVERNIWNIKVLILLSEQGVSLSIQAIYWDR